MDQLATVSPLKVVPKVSPSEEKSRSRFYSGAHPFPPVTPCDCDFPLCCGYLSLHEARIDLMRSKIREFYDAGELDVRMKTLIKSVVERGERSEIRGMDTVPCAHCKSDEHCLDDCPDKAAALYDHYARPSTRTVVYYAPAHIEGECDAKVCRDFFMSLFAIGEGKIERIAKEASRGEYFS